MSSAAEHKDEGTKYFKAKQYAEAVRSYTSAIGVESDPVELAKLLGNRSMVKVQSAQCPSSAPAPPQGAPGGSGQLGTPRKRPAHWALGHCPRCSSQPPPKPPSLPPLTM